MARPTSITITSGESLNISPDYFTETLSVTIQIDADDNIDSLKEHWRKWIDAELRSRMMMHLGRLE